MLAWTETWLSEHVDSSELSSALPQHSWFRRDRPTHAGGVACAVSHALLPERREDLEPAGAELLVVELRAACALVAVVYCPPGESSSIASTFQACQTITARYPGKLFIVAGDFNVPEVRWTPVDRECYSSPVIERPSPRALQLLDGCDTAGLVQHVQHPTRGNNFLDLVMSNDGFVSTTVCDGIFPSDHAEIRCHVRVQIRQAGKALVSRLTVHDYKRADFNGLRRSLRHCDWSLLGDLHVNDAVDVFYSTLQASIQDHIPTLTLKRRYPPWFDSDVRKALAEKESACRALKVNRDTDTLDRFRECRKTFKKLSCWKYFQYLRDITGDFKSNPKRFWSFLKCIRGGKVGSPLCLMALLKYRAM